MYILIKNVKKNKKSIKWLKDILIKPHIVMSVDVI